MTALLGGGRSDGGKEGGRSEQRAQAPQTQTSTIPGLYFVHCNPAMWAPPPSSRTASSTWESPWARLLSLQNAPLAWWVVTGRSQLHQGLWLTIGSHQCPEWWVSPAIYLTADITLSQNQQRWGASDSPDTWAGTGRNYATQGSSLELMPTGLLPDSPKHVTSGCRPLGIVSWGLSTHLPLTATRPTAPAQVCKPLSEIPPTSLRDTWTSRTPFTVSVLLPQCRVPYQSFT